MRRPTILLVATLLVASALTAGAQDRMPPLPTEQLTEQQKQALAEFVAARGQPTGPAGLPIVSLDPIHALGDPLRPLQLVAANLPAIRFEIRLLLPQRDHDLMTHREAVALDERAPGERCRPRGRDARQGRRGRPACLRQLTGQVGTP